MWRCGGSCTSGRPTCSQSVHEPGANAAAGGVAEMVAVVIIMAVLSTRLRYFITQHSFITKVAFAPDAVPHGDGRAACCVVFSAIYRNMPHDRQPMGHRPSCKRKDVITSLNKSYFCS